MPGAARGIENASGFRLRGIDVTRVEQFSDAVFAFALALLVVSTDLPTSTAELFATLRGFPAFGATFAILLWLWHLHHQYFRRYGVINAMTVFLNAVLLFLILFYVYPLRFLFGALFEGAMGGPWIIGRDEGGTLLALYSAGFVAVFTLLALLYWQALAHREALELSSREVIITRGSLQIHLAVAGIGALVALLALIVPDRMLPIAGMTYCLIGPLVWLLSRRTERLCERDDRRRRKTIRAAGGNT